MNREETSGQLVFDLGHETSHGLADFIVTDANALAFDHINNWARWPGSLTLISGPEKSGKTHLARIWAELSGARFCNKASEVEGLAQAGGTARIVLDDVERSEINERALFHLLNQSMRDGRPILMTARAPIAQWDFQSDDVKSRARLATHFSVLATDDLALCQMFAKLFDDRQVVVDPAIISYLVARMERSPREVFELADVLDKLALKRGKAISRSVASEALASRAERKQSEIEL